MWVVSIVVFYFCEVYLWSLGSKWFWYFKKLCIYRNGRGVIVGKLRFVFFVEKLESFVGVILKYRLKFVRLVRIWGYGG